MAELENNINWYPDNFPSNFKVPFLVWNRIEGRPRHEEFLESITMSVHDPLWMLSRQWQLGELKAEDVGSAIKVQMEVESKLISHHSRYQNENFEEFPTGAEEIPLEVLIERLTPKLTLQQRADMGKFFVKLLQKNHTGSAQALNTLKGNLVIDYSFKVPEQPDETNWSTNPNGVDLYASKKPILMIKALSRKIPDGWSIYQRLKSGLGNVSLSGFTGDQVALKNQFIAWIESTYSLPDEDQWHNKNFAYKYKIAHNSDVSSSDHDVLVVDDHKSGKLDWYSFDRDAHVNQNIPEHSEENRLTETETLTVIPTPATFMGMPNKRLWELEDARVDFANLEIDRSEIVKQIVAEYAMVYSNDWFILPYTFHLNSRNKLNSMVVTDVFGQKTLLSNAVTSSPLVSEEDQQKEPWSSWGFFNNDLIISNTDIQDNGIQDLITADDSILVAPTISSWLESDVYEEIYFIRDEVDNKVWAVEQKIFDHLWGGKDGRLSAKQRAALINSILEQTPQENQEYYAQLIYKLGTTVPDNWIPFVPVKKQGLGDRSIVLQRAAMPRLTDAALSHIRPSTSLLREGLNDENTQDAPMYIAEELIPRSGLVLADQYQRTRWLDGKSLLWYSRKLKTSSYPVSNGIDFDNLEMIDKNLVSAPPNITNPPVDNSDGIGEMGIEDTFVVE